jgi:hypothetical protein
MCVRAQVCAAPTTHVAVKPHALLAKPSPISAMRISRLEAELP